MGSPDHMSPELIQTTGDVDERADVWAFAVVLYEAMVGRTPFQGRGQWELFKEVMYGKPRPSTVARPHSCGSWAASRPVPTALLERAPVGEAPGAPATAVTAAAWGVLGVAHRRSVARRARKTRS